MRQGAMPDPAMMDMEAAMGPVEPQGDYPPEDMPEPMLPMPDDGYMAVNEPVFEGDEFGGMVPPDELNGDMS